DSVMIDPDYDGEALDVAIYDVPESKNDLVKGSYELPAPDSGGAVTIAVKITDMLGEEVLTTKEIGSATG
nr:site-specific DNA-methyltransferase [Rubrobacter sp.]